MAAPAGCNANALASNRRYHHAPSLDLSDAPQIDSGLVLKQVPTPNALFCLRRQAQPYPNVRRAAKFGLELISGSGTRKALTT